MANTYHDQLTGSDLHENKVNTTTGTELTPGSQAVYDTRWKTPLDNHVANTGNPHGVTATQAGAAPTSRAINTSAPLTGGGSLSADRTLAIPVSSASQDGYISSVDWSKFNARQPRTCLTVGPSGSTGNDYTGDGTNDENAFNAAISAASAVGGGMIFVRKGSTPYQCSGITPVNNVHLLFENGATLNKRAGSAYGIFRHGDNTNGLTNFTLENGTFTGGACWYSRGNVSYCRFIKNRFYGAVGAIGFIVFFDAFSANPYNTIEQNLFSGPSGGWDMLGSGALDHGSVSFNRFENGDAQGWGITSTTFTRCIGNTFYKVGNAIGMEGVTEGNIIEGNLVYQSGNIKLSLTGGSDISYRNQVIGNKLYYSGGIEDGTGHEEQIIGNHIVRSTNDGIYGAFNHCLISDNYIFDTNWGNGIITVGGVAQTNGGIALLNYPGIPIPTGNVIRGNKLYCTRTAWTYPDATSKTSFTGGILVDSTYTNTEILQNDFTGTYGTVIDYSSSLTLMSVTGGRLGIGTINPNSTFQVAGSIATALATKTTAYTLTAADSIILADTTSAAFTVTLPSAVGCQGRQYTIKRVDSSANAVTIASVAGNIDGAATKTLSAAGQVVRVVSDGANWFVV